ncbi:phenylacetate--CoA ligase family protein [Winogradskyella ursingii]|uniref:phenylacetate--CoA ligase family protein n=1 Tax=Winogradskyella ursingii TaxID=2686079 RepID=UPI0015CB8372|nr:phenylacetate--CoA ligase family protein [Winogradskyella ursingii]
MRKELLLFYGKLNFLFPKLMGIAYHNYKNKRLKKYRNEFDAQSELLTMVNKSINTIPYYKTKYGIDPIQSIEVFHNTIDFIDKTTVMAYWEKFQLPNTPKNKVVSGTTGGTSGKPLKLILPKDRYIFELATMHTMWENVGWTGHTRGVLRNQKLDKREIFKVNPIKKEIIFDGFNTSDAYFENIYQTLKKHNIQYLHAYPSSAFQFSQFLQRKQKNTSFIKAFLCGSEGLLPEQKHLISDILQIPIFHWYGHSEKLILGGYCKASQLVHIEPTYGYFELIDEDGKQITKKGQIGEMVGTTLHNPYMPLIRYKTGDYAEYAGNYCEHCQRHLPLLKKVYGRWDKNKIYKSDGTYITTTALNLHSDIYNKIAGIQYVQKNKGDLIVKIIKAENFNAKDEVVLETHYKSAFGKENNVKIQFVEALQKQPNGKFINLISEIN